MSKRRKCSAEFKHEVVELTHGPQASVSQVAQELRVQANVLSRWRRELVTATGPRPSPAQAYLTTRRWPRSGASWAG